jgi:hypothetical protein
MAWLTGKTDILDEFSTLFGGTDEFTYLVGHADDVYTILGELNLADQRSWEAVEAAATLRLYADAFESFLDDIGGARIPDIASAEQRLGEALGNAIAVLEHDATVGGSTKRKLQKEFLKSLRLLRNGLRQGLRIDSVSQFNLNGELERNYVFSEFGVGEYFDFNTVGSHAAAAMIRDELTVKQLRKLVELVRQYLKANTDFAGCRRQGSWWVLGINRDAIRVLFDTRTFRKDRLYFIFKNESSEKAAESAMLDVAPSDVPFRAL